MFIEPTVALFNSLNVVIKNYTDEQIMLPVSVSKNNKKCLDFDMDNVVFKSVPGSPINCAEVKPHVKTWLDVMEMV
jgi:hypothetical protein